MIKQGYASNVVQKQIDKATSVDREEAFTMIKRTLNGVPLVATYHRDRHSLSQILHRHLPILHNSQTMKLAVVEPPLIANRQPPNQKDLLGRVWLKLA